jgi:hypothetical protein
MCGGNCTVQLFDVQLLGGTTISNALVDRVTKKAMHIGFQPCALSADAIADAIQPYAVKLSGCDGDDCICDPTDPNPKWSDWVAHPINITIEYPAPNGAGGPGAICQTTVIGSYGVSSCYSNGTCITKPAVMPPRKKSNRLRPIHLAVAGGKKKAAKKAVKKAVKKAGKKAVKKPMKKVATKVAKKAVKKAAKKGAKKRG